MPRRLMLQICKKPKAERDTTTTTITAAGQRLVLHCVWICGSVEEGLQGDKERGGPLVGRLLKLSQVNRFYLFSPKPSAEKLNCNRFFHTHTHTRGQHTHMHTASWAGVAGWACRNFARLLAIFFAFSWKCLQLIARCPQNLWKNPSKQKRIFFYPAAFVLVWQLQACSNR